MRPPCLSIGGYRENCTVNKESEEHYEAISETTENITVSAQSRSSHTKGHPPQQDVVALEKLRQEDQFEASLAHGARVCAETISKTKQRDDKKDLAGLRIVY